MTARNIDTIHDRAYALTDAAYTLKETTKAHAEVSARLERAKAAYAVALSQMEVLMAPAPHPPAP